MANQNLQGVDIAIGKLSLPITLATLNGPNNFGESLTLQYSTLSLLKKIRTWNEETSTGVVGLGWTLPTQYIMRIGNGSLNDQFVMANNQPLILISKVYDVSNGMYTLSFGTATHSLLKITYQTIPKPIPGGPVSPELWTVIDENGITYTYGGNSSAGDSSAIEWGIRWMPTDNESPLAWIGTSIATQNQQRYPIAWNLVSKENIYGQCVNYKYFSVSQIVGNNTDPNSKFYTTACYLQSIQVVNGDSIQLNYQEKETYEYPAGRAIINTDGSIINAYQDRIDTQYLKTVSIYNVSGTLQSSVNLTYDFLFLHQPNLTPGNNTDDIRHLHAMEKRLLVGIQYLTPDGNPITPPQLMDYWGLDGKIAFNITVNNLLTLNDTDLWTTYKPQTISYGALYGHLSTLTSSTGSVVRYSYREVSDNFGQALWPESDWDDNWQNKLDLANIPWPPTTIGGEPVSWQNPRPYWGPDNYVVMRWDEYVSNDSDTYRIALKIFEWLGCWTEVSLESYYIALDADATTFDYTTIVLESALSVSGGRPTDPDPNADAKIKIATGNGKFVLCRLGISNADYRGLVFIFNRDPYLPGKWNVQCQVQVFTSTDGSGATTFKVVNLDNASNNYQQLEIGIGTNIISVLDKSAQKLYLYGLQGTIYTAYNNDQGILISNDSSTLASGMAVNNDDVFILGSVTSGNNNGSSYYWLYHYDVTQPNGQWTCETPTNGASWSVQLASLANSDGKIGACTGILFSTMGGGIFTGQAYIADSDAKAVNQDYWMLLAVSWDDNFVVNLQGLYSVDGDGNKRLGIRYEDDKPIGIPDVSGSLSASNLINMIPADYSTSSRPRYIIRYAGGSDSNDTFNIGWIADSHFTMSSDNTDDWTQLATLDTTIDINGDGYHFYQYTPYGNASDSHPYWCSQDNVSSALGKGEDWENVWREINEIISLVGLVVQAATVSFGGMALEVEAAIETAEKVAAKSALKIAEKVGSAAMVAINLTQKFVRAEAKNGLSGRKDGLDQGMNYLLVGPGGIGKPTIDINSHDYDNGTDEDSNSYRFNTDYGSYQPAAFAKIWDPVNHCWSWQSISNLVQTPSQTVASNMAAITALSAFNQSSFNWSKYEGYLIPFLSQPTYSYGNHFIPFSYILYGGRAATSLEYDSYFCNLYYDQIAFFQNSQALNVSLLPMWATGNLPGSMSGNLPYIIYNDTSSTGPNPLMYAPWGGILAYQPQPQPIYVSYSPGNTTTKWICEGYKGSGNPPANIADSAAGSQPSLQTAQNLLLTMALNGFVSGNIADYVIDAIYIDDGYQTYNTFFQYMPGYANFQSSLNAVVYNQVRVARGDSSYSTSAINNGWVEYYFYTGGFNYAGSNSNPPLSNPPNPLQQLPYDPAGQYDSFSVSNSSYTNASLYYSLMAGQLYCQRTLQSQGGGDFSQGYEVARQQIFIKGYEINLAYDNQGKPLTPQKVTGSLTTITVNYIAPSTSTNNDITEAYKNSLASLNATYYFYDLDFVDSGNNPINFYGPWNPNTPSTPPTYIPLRTALSLGKIDYNFHQINSQNSKVIEGIYTQTMPLFVAALQSNGVGIYQKLMELHVYSNYVQTVNWYHPNLSQTTLSQMNPEKSWGATPPNGINWQIVNSTVTTWQELTNNGAPLIYPGTTYRWQGNNDGTAQISPLVFPWITPPVNLDNTVWLQQSSAPTQINEQGMILASQTVTAVPTYITYDNYSNVVAQFTNSSANSNLAFYTGFEAYEDLSAWQLVNQAHNTLPMSFCSLSDTGNRSLIVYNDNILSITFSTPLSDSRAWLYCCCVLFPQSIETAVTLTLSNNSQKLAQVKINLKNSDGWKYLHLVVPNNAISGIANLALNINLSSDDNVIYIDNMYFVPITTSVFSLQTYDETSGLTIATASQTDPNFSTRVIYNNLKQPIGTVIKANQMLINQTVATENQAAAKVTLTNQYFSRNNANNQNNFSPSDPNASFIITSGMNQTMAGYYFDFRDGQNDWTSDSIRTNARFLSVSANKSASYPLPLPFNWGFGIRLQLQGYTQTIAPLNLTTQVTDAAAVGFPTPGEMDSFHLWGVFQTQEAPGNYGAFDIVFDDRYTGSNRLSTYPAAAIENQSTSILADNRLLVSDNLDNLFCTLADDQDQYTLFLLFRVENDGIYSYQATKVYKSGAIPLYAPLVGNNNRLYVADHSNALYAINLQNANAQPDLGFLATQVFSYGDQFSNAICPVAPVIDTARANIVFLLTNPTSSENALVKYSIADDRATTLTLSHSISFTSVPLITIADNGSVFVCVNNQLYGYDAQLNPLEATIPLSGTVSGLVTGNGCLSIAFQTGDLFIYSLDLSFIAQVDTGLALNTAPVVHGDKISVIGQNDQNQWVIYTCNSSGILMVPPYIVDAQTSTSVNIQAFTPSQSSLCVMCDNKTFMRLDLRIPSATLSMGDIVVSWDATHKQYSITAPLITSPQPITVNNTYGDWLLYIMGNIVYFYADGQQIFAEQLSALPTGNFVIAAEDEALGCRDIVIFTDPSLSVVYSDGAGKTRQTQSTAEIEIC